MRYDRERVSLYVNIGERIHVLRRRAGVSQRDFGQRLGISGAAVSYLETGHTKPNLDNLTVIAEALGVPISAIVTMEQRPTDTMGEAVDA